MFDGRIFLVLWMVNHFSPPGEEGKALVAEEAGPSLGQRLIEFLSKKMDDIFLVDFWWHTWVELEKPMFTTCSPCFFDEIPTWMIHVPELRRPHPTSLRGFGWSADRATRNSSFGACFSAQRCLVWTFDHQQLPLWRRWWWLLLFIYILFIVTTLLLYDD